VLQSIQPFLTALAPLDTSSSTPSSSAITTALNSICSSSNAPSSSLYGSQLAEFYQACQAELTTSKIPDVGVLYDSIYMLVPFVASLCQKDSSGNLCVTAQSSSTTNTTKRSLLDSRDSSEQVNMPDASIFSQDDVAFLGISPNSSAAQLCTPCTRGVMNGYTSQLNSIPYGPGAGSSVLFPGLTTLYNAINQKCGSSFLNGQVQAAGGLATGAALQSVDGGFASFVGSAIAAAAGAVALL
jgi:hypothetical protein